VSLEQSTSIIAPGNVFHVLGRMTRTFVQRLLVHSTVLNLSSERNHTRLLQEVQQRATPCGNRFLCVRQVGEKLVNEIRGVLSSYASAFW